MITLTPSEELFLALEALGCRQLDASRIAQLHSTDAPVTPEWEAELQARCPALWARREELQIGLAEKSDVQRDELLLGILLRLATRARFAEEYGADRGAAVECLDECFPWWRLFHQTLN